MKLQNATAYLVLIAIVVVGFVVYLLKAFSSPLVYGIDGPYYVLQVRHLLSHGCLKYLDPPLAFYVLAGFSVLFGDVFIGVKVGSIVFFLAASIPLFFLVERLGGRVDGLVAAASYVFSGYLVRLGFDFLKNAMGLLFLALFFYMVVRGFERDEFRYSLLASLTLIVVGLTHILDFGVGYGFAIILLVYGLFSKDKVLFKHAILPVVVGSIMLVAGFTVYTLMGGDPYKALNLLRLIGEEADTIMLSPWELAKTITPLILGVAGILLSTRLKTPARQVIIACSIILLALNTPLIPLQYLWRFNLMTVILAPIILGVLVGSIRDEKLSAITGLVIIGLLLPQFIVQLQTMHPSIPEKEYQELKQLIDKIPVNTLIITPDTRLRYWVETLYENVARRPPGPTPYPQLIVVDKNPIARKPWIPPRSIEYFKGEYIEAYLIQPS